jgi:hypothetical protein
MNGGGRRQGSGRRRGSQGLGSGGRCICAKCGHAQAHQPGRPCIDERCPECGGTMLREGSEHHRKTLAKEGPTGEVERS